MSYWFKDDFNDVATLTDLVIAFKTGSIDHTRHDLFWSDNTKYLTLIIAINEALSNNESGFAPVDDYLVEHFGDLEVNPKYVYKNANNQTVVVENYPLITPIINVIDTILAENFYKYSTLLNTLSLEYNPIWNVDSEETATESRDERNETNTEGPETTQTNLGHQQNTYTYGSAVETNHHQSVTTTFTNGAFTTTNGIENGHNKVERTTNFNTQMNDTADWYNHDRSEKETQPYEEYTTKGAQTNSETVPEHTDTLTKVKHTDEEALGAKANSESTSGRTDTVHKDAYEDTTHIVRQGNIGTTTTQQMITEERELAKFSLLDVIAKDFVKALCTAVYY